MLRGKFTAPNSYIRKKEMSQIKDLYSPFRKTMRKDILLYTNIPIKSIFFISWLFYSKNLALIRFYGKIKKKPN